MASQPLAYSYIRFSHPDQAKGDSLRRQSELRDDWLTRNKVILDTSLTLEDKGVSGFTGSHRQNPDRHSLAMFLKLVEQGKVKRGSYLIIENLDRLSREEEVPACNLLTGILMAGVKVVQLCPSELVLTEKSGGFDIMRAVMELSRGHAESAMKSERVGRAWQEKRRRARNGETQTPTKSMGDKSRALTRKLPAWLRWVDGEIVADAKDTKTIRHIFQLATEGYGTRIITRMLNDNGVPLVARTKRSKRWVNCYVVKILSNRAVLGEYQPYKGRIGKRQPDGDPMPDYYPRVIEDDEWYAARAAVASRRGKVGRPAKHHTNVFTGLLFDARDGGTFQLVNRGKNKGGSYVLVPYNAAEGLKGSVMVSFPFLTFEAAIFACLKEVDTQDILPQRKKTDRTSGLKDQLAVVVEEIEKMKARLASRYSDSIADVLERREDEQRKLKEELALVRQEAAIPLADAWKDCHSLLDAIKAAPNEEEDRVRLRANLRRTIEGIWCLFVPRGSYRIAEVQIHFKEGGYRSYLIIHRPATGGIAGVRSPMMYVNSIKQPEASEHGLPFKMDDLRDSSKASNVLVGLEDYPLWMIEGHLDEGGTSIPPTEQEAARIWKQRY
jgi:DNA invertase Pin-like site-specific DNA recombinase